MRTADLDAPRIESRPGSKVGSFRDLHGAALAVRRLVERGFSSDEVFVRPHRMQPLEGSLEVPARRGLRRRATKTALLAASLGGAALVATTGRLGWGTVAAMIGVAIIAGVLTAAVGRMQAWRVERRRRRTSSLVRVTHFDVVATSRPEDAEHQLASWWDPEAAPAGSRVRS